MIFTGSCINCNQKTAQICAVCARNESQQVQFCCKKRECRVSENFKSHLAFHEIEGKRTGQLESGAKPKRKRRMEGPSSSSSSSEESSSAYGGTTYSSDSDSEEEVLVKKFIQAEEIFEDPISMEFWNSKFFVGLRLAMQDSFHSMNVHDWLQKWYNHSNAVMFFILGLAVSQFWVLVRNDQTGRCFASHSMRENYTKLSIHAVKPEVIGCKFADPRIGVDDYRKLKKCVKFMEVGHKDIRIPIRFINHEEALKSYISYNTTIVVDGQAISALSERAKRRLVKMFSFLIYIEFRTDEPGRFITFSYRHDDWQRDPNFTNIPFQISDVLLETTEIHHK